MSVLTWVDRYPIKLVTQVEDGAFQLDAVDALAAACEARCEEEDGNSTGIAIAFFTGLFLGAGLLALAVSTPHFMSKQ